MTSLVLACVALAAAGVVYGLYALAEGLVRRGVVGRRDWVMLPGLVVVVSAIGLGLAWVDVHRPGLLAGVGFAAFLGLNLGRGAWRVRG